MPRQAPSTKLVLPGSVTASREGTTVSSAAVPHGRCHWTMNTQTRSPIREAGTPGPTLSMTPAPSWWGTTRGKPIGRDPARDFTSVGFRPEATIRTRTSPGPGSGTGISPTRKTSAAGPFFSYQAAFTMGDDTALQGQQDVAAQSEDGASAST